MNRNDAKIIAKTITFEQIFQMLDNAQKLIVDWREVSRINQGITKGTSWNLLVNPFKNDNNVDELIIFYLIYEFGDYLPQELKVKKTKKKNKIIPIHQDPIF